MRRLITLGLLGALACLALPAAAAAADSPVAKFRVLVQATQKTKWTKPLKVGERDCFNRPWSKGSGEETVTMKGSGIVYAQAIADFDGFTYDSPDYGPAGSSGIPLRATATRRNDSLNGALPGRCGGGRPEERVPYVCDDEQGAYYGQLRWEGDRRLALHTMVQRRERPMTWWNCPLEIAKAASPANITPISQRITPRELVDRRFKKHIILASKTFREVLYPGNLDIETTTTTRWQITLYRLKK
jgi:hypothetical protein